jgi:hypothetical protein
MRDIPIGPLTSSITPHGNWCDGLLLYSQLGDEVFALYVHTVILHVDRLDGSQEACFGRRLLQWGLGNSRSRS